MYSLFQMGIIKSLPLGCKLRFIIEQRHKVRCKCSTSSCRKSSHNHFRWNGTNSQIFLCHHIRMRQKLLKHLQIRIFSFRQISCIASLTLFQRLLIILSCHIQPHTFLFSKSLVLCNFILHHFICCYKYS